MAVARDNAAGATVARYEKIDGESYQWRTTNRANPARQSEPGTVLLEQFALRGRYSRMNLKPDDL